jgi:hypothetical protein
VTGAGTTSWFLRQFFVDRDFQFEGYSERQALYLDAATGELRRDTEVWQDGVLQIKVNRLGCKGPEIDPELPVIAFFGDGATMGHSFVPFSWPLHVRARGFAVLNAAVEGSDLAHMAARFERLQRSIPLACAVVCGSWRDLIGDRRDDDDRRRQLARFLGDQTTVFCTLPTCLTDGVCLRGIEPLLNRAPVTRGVATREEADSLDADYFSFWLDLDPATMTGPLLDAVRQYNGFVTDFAAEHGSPLVDLHAFLEPRAYDEVPRDFYDAGHLRPRAYPKTGSFVSRQLATILLASSVRDQRDLAPQVHTSW